MARIRTIKPEFWEDEKLADIPMLARLFFIGTWNFADDYGVILNSPKYLKSKIFPYDESLRESQIKTWLDALIEARMLVPFDYKNKSYLYIRTFMSHQVIDKRYTKSILPDGISAEKVLAGLGFEQNTTSSHSERHVFTPPEKEKEKEKEKERKGNGIGNGNAREGFDENFLIPQIIAKYAEVFPEFIRDDKKDKFSARRIFEIITGNANVEKINHDEFLFVWQNLCEGMRDKKSVQFYAGNGLTTIANNLPTIIQKIRNNGSRTNQSRTYSTEDFTD